MNISIKTYDNPTEWIGYIDADPFTLFFPVDGGDPVMTNKRAVRQDENGRAYAICKPSEWPEISRKLRELAGIKQEDLAAALGFKLPATISRYESGKRHVNVGELEAIAAALGYEVELRLTEKNRI